MNYENELRSYHQYINAYYPQSLIVTQFRKYQSDFLLVFKSLNMIEVVSDYSYNECICNDLLADIENLLLKLMYITPTNDSFYISTTFRAISEACLRLFISTSEENNLSTEKIKMLAYRHLWAECKKVKKTEKCKINLDRLNMMFRLNSDEIHNKELIENHIDYLESIMEQEKYSYNYSDFQRNIKDIHEFIVIHLPDLYYINYDLISTPHKHLYRLVFT